MLELSEYLQIFIALLAIISPLTVSFIFLALAGHKPKPEQHKIINQATLICIAILCFIAIFGQDLLNLFNISISSFKVSGGILLSLVAFDLLRGAEFKADQSQEQDQQDQAEMIGVMPLGIPLLSGPGAMSSVIIYANMSDAALHILILCLIITIIGFIIFIILRLAKSVQKLLGKTLNAVLNRIMGLILLAIAIEFMVSGLLILLPGLA